MFKFLPLERQRQSFNFHQVCFFPEHHQYWHSSQNAEYSSRLQFPTHFYFFHFQGLSVDKFPHQRGNANPFLVSSNQGHSDFERPRMGPSWVKKQTSGRIAKRRKPIRQLCGCINRLNIPEIVKVLQWI